LNYAPEAVSSADMFFRRGSNDKGFDPAQRDYTKHGQTTYSTKKMLDKNGKPTEENGNIEIFMRLDSY